MIYMNNAATSYPKFQEVTKAVTNALASGEIFCNRDSVDYIDVERKIFELRQSLSKIFGAKEPHCICLMPSDTVALNTLISSVHGGVVLTGDMEHNSVTRPLVQAAKNGSIWAWDTFPLFDGSAADALQEKLDARDDVSAVIFSHSSNVTGNTVPGEELERIGQMLERRGIPFFLDVAQSAGIAKIEVDKWRVSALAFAGHKALGGPQGTGGLYIRRGAPVEPLLFGGSGDSSMEIDPGVSLPNSFEVGTPAVHDLLGLAAALKKIEEIGERKYANRILYFSQFASDGLRAIPGVTVFGAERKTSSAVSFIKEGYSPKEIGEALAKRGIVCRTGAHCSALAMKALGRKDGGGTVRISCGYMNTEEEISEMLGAVRDLS